MQEVQWFNGNIYSRVRPVIVGEEVDPLTGPETFDQQILFGITTSKYIFLLEKSSYDGIQFTMFEKYLNVYLKKRFTLGPAMILNRIYEVFTFDYFEDGPLHQLYILRKTTNISKKSGVLNENSFVIHSVVWDPKVSSSFR